MKMKLKILSIKDYEDDDTEKKGIGTPATRSNIIEKIISVGYVIRKGKSLIPTEKGINAIKIINEKIKSPQLTVEWETKLQKIEQSTYNSDEFLKEITEFIEHFIKEHTVDTNIKKELENLNEKKKETIGICPKCGSNVYESSKNFYCFNKECNFAMFKEDKFFKNKKVKLTKTKAKELLENGHVKFDKLYS